MSSGPWWLGEVKSSQDGKPRQEEGQRHAKGRRSGSGSTHKYHPPQQNVHAQKEQTRAVQQLARKPFCRIGNASRKLIPPLSASRRCDRIGIDCNSSIEGTPLGQRLCFSPPRRLPLDNHLLGAIEAMHCDVQTIDLAQALRVRRATVLPVSKTLLSAWMIMSF